MLAESSRKGLSIGRSTHQGICDIELCNRKAFFPVCRTCSRTLYQCRLGNFQKGFNPGFVRITRINAVCPCRICAIAKADLISHGPCLFLQKLCKCAPSVLLSFIKVVFVNFLTMLYIGCGHQRSDGSSKRAQIENGVNMTLG